MMWNTIKFYAYRCGLRHNHMLDNLDCVERYLEVCKLESREQMF